MSHIFGALAEFERELIRERTQAGLDAARALGRRGGRPTVMPPDKGTTARQMYDSKELTVEAIARVLGVSRASIYRHLAGPGAERGGGKASATTGTPPTQSLDLVPVGAAEGSEQAGYGRFPELIERDWPGRRCHLSEADVSLARRRTGDVTCLGFAVRLVTVRAIGTFLADPSAVPAPIVATVARQLDVTDPGVLTGCSKLAVRWKHIAEIRRRYGYTDFAAQPGDISQLRWLYRQAWADDLGPSVLFRAAQRWMLAERVVLPGENVLNPAGGNRARAGHPAAVVSTRSRCLSRTGRSAGGAAGGARGQTALGTGPFAASARQAPPSPGWFRPPWGVSSRCGSSASASSTCPACGAGG